MSYFCFIFTTMVADKNERNKNLLLVDRGWIFKTSETVYFRLRERKAFEGL